VKIKKRKFLIIRFSSIGDIVLTTPVIRCLKQQVPDAEVHFLTKKSYKTIIKHNPYIDTAHYYKDNMPELLEKLRKEKFDYIIDLHNNIRTRYITFRLGVKAYRFPKLNWEKWLYTDFKIGRLPDVHVVDRYLSTLKDFNVVNDGAGLDYFIHDSDVVQLSRLPETMQQGYTAFVIGGKHTTKQLPYQQIYDVCKLLGSPIILLGSHSETDMANTIKNALGNRIFNGCGRYNINESASLLQQADKVISHDTGLMHIAAALKKPVISVWGNTVPEYGMYPYYGTKKDLHLGVVEVADLECRPCSKLGFEKCPKGHFECMRKIDIEEIVRLAQS
jgi:ADP-heptose:LPS heptosyltransferase